MDRRAFLQSISTAPLWNGLNRSIGRGRSSDRPSEGEREGQSSDRPAAQGRKALIISLLPKDGSYAQRFKIARDAGFDAIEMQTIAREDEAAEIRDAAMKTGLRIHSVMNAEHWRSPLSSSDRGVVNTGVAGMESRCATRRGGAPIPCCWCRPSSTRRPRTGTRGPGRSR